MSGREPRTVRALELLREGGEVDLDDPAEVFHEASRAYPTYAARRGRGAALLARHPELRASAARSTSRPAEGTPWPLPPPQLPAVDLPTLVRRRRSCRAFEPTPVTLVELATLLHASYGVTHRPPPESGLDGQSFRAVPSGGGLYPLELTVCAWRVDGLEPGAYRYDPLRHELLPLGTRAAREAVRAAMVYPELVEDAPCLLVLSGVFLRSRFKYGQRGYRFVLLEAGHVAQNLILAAGCLGLGSVPVGGFFDTLLDAVVAADGVEAASLYAVVVGRSAEGDA